jgi:mycothiol synthase
VTLSVSPAVDARAAIEALDRKARAATGHEALGDAVWLDLDAPRPGSAGFFAYGDGHREPLGYVHVARADNAAGDSAGATQWSVGLVVDPTVEPGLGTAPALLHAARNHVASAGGGTLVLWRTGATGHDDHDARAAWFEVARELLQLRVALPLTEEPEWPPSVTVRAYEPGRDDEEWVALNNRAFAHHAEQGNWTVETLRRRMAEPWFDPSLFLLACDTGSGDLIGFNWCKVHPPAAPDPALGEIYVIGVDPGSPVRVGRPLALAGLAAMANRGITTGMLYCAADNERALRLYRSLGFTTHRVDRAYECHLAP